MLSWSVQDLFTCFGVCAVTAYPTIVPRFSPPPPLSDGRHDSFPIILEKKKISLSHSTENQNLGITSAGEGSYTTNVIRLTFFGD